MISLISPIETILDKRAQHAMLLVDAVEERANVTMLAKDTIRQPHGFLDGHRILTFTQRKARSDPAYRFDAEPVRSRTVRHHRGVDERDQPTLPLPRCRRVVVAASLPRICVWA